MQDVTDLSFMKLSHQFGGPDVFFTEYFRVYPGSHLSRFILRSITENDTGVPVVAQMIGNDVPALVKNAKELQNYPVAGIDLNLGCPAPVVYRKCAGGGLLRTPEQIDSILGHLRQAITGTPFTVKTRVGFDTPEVFPALLEIFARHSLDMLTVHGRTVKEMYRSPVRFDLIAEAVRQVPAPVIANGNVYSAQRACQVLDETRVRGLMIGRGAIRNPWMFRQIREQLEGRPVFVPVGRQVLGYVERLYESATSSEVRESSQVQRMKKYLNFIGLGVDREGGFLHRMRRVTRKGELFQICREYMNHDEPMPLDPFRLGLPETDILAGEHH
jgi:tRNA-dihydrouridine synthase